MSQPDNPKGTSDQDQAQKDRQQRSAGIDNGPLGKDRPAHESEQRATFERTDEDLDQEWRRAGGGAQDA